MGRTSCKLSGLLAELARFPQSLGAFSPLISHLGRYSCLSVLNHSPQCPPLVSGLTTPESALVYGEFPNFQGGGGSSLGMCSATPPLAASSPPCFPGNVHIFSFQSLRASSSLHCLPALGHPIMLLTLLSTSVKIDHPCPSQVQTQPVLLDSLTTSAPVDHPGP